RYEGAQELAADVERYLAGEPGKAYPEPFLSRAWPSAQRHRPALGRGAAAVLALAIGGFAFAQINEAQKRALAFQQHARQLEEQNQAREEIKTFRRLADEARFYLANLNPVSESAPYYELDKGEKAARAALSV